MRELLAWKKLLILGVLLCTPLALAQCGGNLDRSTAQQCSGVSNPTVPGKLQFQMCVAPHTIQNEGTVLVTVRVWDENGFEVPGIFVSVVGPQTAGEFTTDVNGIAQGVLEVKGDAGGIIWLTAGIENETVTVPVQIVPIGGGEEA